MTVSEKAMKRGRDPELRRLRLREALVRFEEERAGLVREVEHMPARLQATRERHGEIIRLGDAIRLYREMLGDQAASGHAVSSDAIELSCESESPRERQKPQSL